MPVDVSGALRQALAKLEGERVRIDRQIAGLRQALQADSGGGRAGRRRTPSDRAKGGRGAKRGRKRMSPAERKAVSARMKAFWAKRKAKGSQAK